MADMIIGAPQLSKEHSLGKSADSQSLEGTPRASMNRYVEVLLGFNFGALVRDLGEGPRSVCRASRAAYLATRSAKKAEPDQVHEQFESIPAADLEQLLGARKCTIRLRVMRYEDGMMPCRDAIGLLTMLVADNPGEVLEIGTYMGHTTRAMAENLEHAIIHTLDLPLDFSPEQDPAGPVPKDDFHLISRRVVGREYKGQPCESRIVQHFGDTAAFDFQRAGRPTFFFIDGSHTYEYCKNDSEKCLSLCPKGGTFLWHDCNETHPGVLRFLCEWRGLGRNIVRIHGTDLAYWKSGDTAASPTPSEAGFVQP